MDDPESAQTARIGVALVQLAVVQELGWLFRNQPVDDYGIDAQIEVVDRGTIVPRLLAVQIKSGDSFFEHPTSGGWWFYPDERHVRYWLDHSLPVVVVLVDPEAGTAYWQAVTSRTLERTRAGGWKLRVPSEQLLDASATDALRELADGDPYVLRIRELQLARPWMHMLEQGRRLTVDIEEWINKTSGRGTITLGEDKEDGNEPAPLAEWGVLLGLSNYAEIVPRLFAWADVGLHAETYDDAAHDQWESESLIDEGDGDTFAIESYEDWQSRRSLQPLRPYANGAGEVDFWRLELTLNELGRAFLLVDRFATEGLRQLTP